MATSRFSPLLGRILRYGLTLVILGWLFARLDWAAWQSLREPNWRLAIPAIALCALAYAFQAWRWQVLLRAQSIALPTGTVHAIFWVGFFYNSTLPGGVAGDAVRYAMVVRRTPAGKAAILASLLSDRLIGLIALFALAAAALTLHGTTGDTSSTRGLLAASAGGTLLLIAAAWMLGRTSWWEPLSARVIGAERTAAFRTAAHGLARSHGALLAAGLISVSLWLADFLSVWLLARSLGLTAGLLEVSVAAAAAYVAAALPVSIGGHGIREATLSGLLTLLGIGLSTPHLLAALAVAFLGLNLAATVAGGLVHLFLLSRGEPAEPAA